MSKRWRYIIILAILIFLALGAGCQTQVLRNQLALADNKQLNMSQHQGTRQTPWTPMRDPEFRIVQFAVHAKIGAVVVQDLKGEYFLELVDINKSFDSQFWPGSENYYVIAIDKNLAKRLAPLVGLTLPP